MHTQRYIQIGWIDIQDGSITRKFSVLYDTERSCYVIEGSCLTFDEPPRGMVHFSNLDIEYRNRINSKESNNAE